jgi:hypothetical protein
MKEADLGKSEGRMGEDSQQRTARELIELLNELRVILPGVQFLFAFLLTVPFSQRFPELDGLETGVFFVTLLCTAIATALLMAPSAQHRVLWREGAAARAGEHAHHHRPGLSRARDGRGGICRQRFHLRPRPRPRRDPASGGVFRAAVVRPSAPLPRSQQRRMSL